MGSVYGSVYGGSIDNATLTDIIEGLAAALASGVDLNVFAAATGHSLTIFEGDAYLASQGTEIPIVKRSNETHWPDTVSSVHFTCQPTRDTLNDDSGAASLNDIACTSVTNSSFNLELTAAQTATLTVGAASYDFWLIANQGTYPKTLRSGRMTVKAQPA